MGNTAPLSALPTQETALKKSPYHDENFPVGNNREPLAVPMVRVPEWLGISRSKAYEEIAAGRLKAVKCGSKTLITYASGRAWLAALPALAA
jgi:excisionase family DNA binding protein